MKPRHVAVRALFCLMLLTVLTSGCATLTKHAAAPDDASDTKTITAVAPPEAYLAIVEDVGRVLAYVYTAPPSQIPAIWPVEASGRYISDCFKPSGRSRQQHKGVDIIVPRGTPVCASAGGRVSFAGLGRGYGHMVKIDHLNGYETWYAHLDFTLVTAGDILSSGDQIGCAGHSGNATTDHLHYEIHKNGQPVNPEAFLKQ